MATRKGWVSKDQVVSDTGVVTRIGGQEVILQGA
jgi:hypothetical protein